MSETPISSDGPEPTGPWSVSGLVQYADGKPAQGLELRLYARNRSKLRHLGKTTTDPIGKYEATFSGSDLQGPGTTQSRMDVFIGVFDDCDQQIAQSATISITKDAPGRLDLVLSREWIYLPYDKDDQAYFGCDAVVRSEWPYIQQRRARQQKPVVSGSKETHEAAPPNLCGIALSGGGIRSASFCLGILQALSYEGWLKKVDYLSMVSGGGYIGGSLAWLLHKEWKGEKGETIPYGVSRDDFPFGSYPMVGMSGGSSPASPQAQPWEVYKGRILGYLRQHASYLTPGNGIDAFSLLAVVLRNSVFSILAYGGLLVAIFALLGPLLFSNELLPEVARDHLNLALATALAFGALFLLWILAYPLVNFIIKQSNEDNTGYCWRYVFEKRGGTLLKVVGVLAVLGVLPSTHAWVKDLATSIPALPHLIQEHAVPVIGTLSTLLGGLTTIWGYFGGGKKRTAIPTGFLIPLGAACLIFGLLLLSYSLAEWVRGGPGNWNSFEPGGLIMEHPGLFALGAVIFLGLLLFANLNYLSMHRYYRDRLMETFTPDIPDALNVNGPEPGAKKSADWTVLAAIARDFCPKPNAPSNRDDAMSGDKSRVLGPYPIINTNIVLVSSRIPKFRGRGGDNFILTPLYCGSNATGWCSTVDEMSPFRDMTLPTAIATSGAAIDPNTGSGGEGPTRSALLSFLMGFFNVRLGYWATNPTPPEELKARVRRYEERTGVDAMPSNGKPGGDNKLQDQQSDPRWRRILWAVRCSRPIVRANEPNVLYPGLSELYLRKNLDENSRMVQLSDGGHFENLGLYELVRRRLRLIIACDGAAHPKFDFSDLGNAIEKIRADFGALIEISSQDLKALTPPTRQDKVPGYATRGYLVAPIKYNDGTSGTLIYMTTTFFRTLSVDLHAYRTAHAEFPNQSTADQFFDEKQFEAYRELGYKTAYDMVKNVTCPV